MGRLSSNFLIRSLAIVVVLGLFAAYYAGHPPLGEGMLAELMRRFADLAIGLAVFSLAGALGTHLLINLEAPKLARFALRGALGLGLIGLLFFLVGSLLGLSGLLFWPVLLLGLAMLGGSWTIWVRDLDELKLIWTNSESLLKWVLALIALIFSFALLQSLLPPLKYDALVYHLTLPEIYVAQGQIGYVQGNLHWGFPQLPHMLYTLALVLGASQPAILGWLMGLLAVLGLAGHLAERLGSQMAGWAAPAVLLAGTSPAQSLAWGYVDWPTILFGWSLLFALDNYLEKNERHWLILAALGAGFAFGSKYPAGLLTALTFLALLGSRRVVWKNALLFMGISLAVALPWLLRNFLFTGNPIYPMLLPGGEMDAFRLQATQGLPPQGNWLDFLLLPFRATLFAIEGARLGNAPGYEASIGPLLLGLALFAWLGRKKLGKQANRTLFLLTLMSLGTLLVWAVGARLTGHLARTHLYYFAFPSFAGLAAFGFAAMRRRLRLKLTPLVLLGSLALSSLTVAASSFQSGVLETFFNQEAEQNYLTRNLGLYALVTEHIREQLPTGARVLMLWEARSFYCALQCDPDDILDHWREAQHRRGRDQALSDYWLGQGYSYVLYHRVAAQFIAQDPNHYLPFNIDEVEAALSGLTTLEDFNGAYLLYDLQR